MYVQDLETVQSNGKNIHPSIRQWMKAYDAGCTTNSVGLRKGSKGFVSLADQNNTKQLAAVQAGLNHFPVTGFKDVKFKRHARKQDGVQWKKR